MSRGLYITWNILDDPQYNSVLNMAIKPVFLVNAIACEGINCINLWI